MVRRQTWQPRRFEIFESARHFGIESNLDVRFEFEQNLETSHVPIKKLHTLLVSLYFQRSLRYIIGDVKARNGPKFEFFSNFWPILWNPFAKVDGSMPECAQVCALHIRLQSTALGDAKENRNGRRLSPYRRKTQNWYYVTHFLARPVEPHERWVHTHGPVGQGRDKAFFFMLLICLYF